MTATQKSKPIKRKADELDTPTSGSPDQVAPQPKKVKTDNAALTPDISAPTSRSGRVIKPKKFVDDLTPSKTVNILSLV